jgi:hypothetical protein
VLCIATTHSLVDCLACIHFIKPYRTYLRRFFCLGGKVKSAGLSAMPSSYSAGHINLHTIRLQNSRFIIVNAPWHVGNRELYLGRRLP